jgi:hypothetical protein
MTKYVSSGWYEFLLPVRSTRGPDFLRVWIDMKDVVPMLKRLDALYGDAEHPYCRDLTQMPEAARDLVRMVVEHVLKRSDSVRRISARRALAAELHERFGVEQSRYPIAYPEVIDQVDLDLSHALLMLPLIFDLEPPPATDADA